jgi:hypothetical protein
MDHNQRVEIVWRDMILYPKMAKIHTLGYFIERNDKHTIFTKELGAEGQPRNTIQLLNSDVIEVIELSPKVC